MHTATPFALLLLMAPTALSAHDISDTVRFRVPMSCAALASIHAAEYPDPINVYNQAQAARSYNEANRATLGMLWRHRHDVAQTIAASAFMQSQGRPPTKEELDAERARWVRTMTHYTSPLREALAQNCEALFDIADRYPDPITPD